MRVEAQTAEARREGAQEPGPEGRGPSETHLLLFGFKESGARAPKLPAAGPTDVHFSERARGPGLPGSGAAELLL